MNACARPLATFAATNGSGLTKLIRTSCESGTMATTRLFITWSVASASRFASGCVDSFGFPSWPRNSAMTLARPLGLDTAFWKAGSDTSPSLRTARSASARLLISSICVPMKS